MDKLAVLGPKGTFSDAAAQTLKKEYDIVYFPSHEEIFSSLTEGRLNHAIVAIENQLSGTIVENLDNIYRHNLFVLREIVIPIHHCICALSKNEKIKKIYSHPQGFSQCKEAISRYKNIEKIETESTADAFRIVKENSLKNCACIGTAHAAEIYGLKIIKRNIEDYKHNQTRFFLISKEKKINGKADKTSIVFKVRHEPGALINCLQRLAKNNINLTKLESRPIPESPWEYLFYADFEGSLDDENVKLALSEMEAASIFIKILGSFPLLKPNL